MNSYMAVVGKSEGDYLEDLVIGGKVLVKWIVEKKDRVMWTGFIYLRR